MISAEELKENLVNKLNYKLKNKYGEGVKIEDENFLISLSEAIVEEMKKIEVTFTMEEVGKIIAPPGGGACSGKLTGGKIS